MDEEEVRDAHQAFQDAAVAVATTASLAATATTSGITAENDAETNGPSGPLAALHPPTPDAPTPEEGSGKDHADAHASVVNP